jgi:Protein of unknown function (DUF3303)
MKFMVTWKIAPTQMAPAVARFLKTGGMPPKGVKLLGRWHGSGVGFALADCKDGKALYEWMAGWSDQLELTVCPVVEDREGAAVLRRVYKGR